MLKKNKKSNVIVDNPLVKAIGTQKVVVVIVLIALFGFFCIMSPTFRQYSTILSILDFSYYITFMSIGVTFCLITGGVDLSIGTGMICCGLVGGYFVNVKGMPVMAGIFLQSWLAWFLAYSMEHW